MNKLLWVLQIVLGVNFILVGFMHYIVPPGLPSLMSWMYELSTPLHIISGTAELLGGLGWILPGLTKIQTRLTPLAAAGLALVMILAIVYHVSRGEYPNVATNFIFAAVLGFVAYGRWKLQPLDDGSEKPVAA